MADPVPVYQHETAHGADGYSLDLDSTAHGPFSAGEPLFYAYEAPKGSKKPAGARPGYSRQTTPPDPPAFYYDDTDETVPVYRDSGGGNRFYFHTQSAKPGVRRGQVAFYAYDPETPPWGTIPIYVHQTPAGRGPQGSVRYHYDDQSNPPAGYLPGAVVFYAEPLGYRVGDKAAEISGPDQHNNAAQLSSLYDGRSWVLIDICAQWCTPCQMLTAQINAFLDNVNSQGVPLKLFSVLTDNRDGKPSNQTAADQWAVRYGLKDSVVHCGGDPNSQLQQLVPRYARANGSSTPGYPTSVLVDPQGKVRHYQLGYDPGALLSALASHSGQSLTGGPGH